MIQESMIFTKEMTLSKKNFDLVKDLDAIYIIGKGASAIKCPEKKPEGKQIEYWGANNIFKLRNLDRVFVMRDLYVTQFNQDRELIKKLNELDKPVYTLGGYSELTNNVIYPMTEVIADFDLAYFLNTAAFMMALAIMLKPKEIHLFGIDMNFGSMTEYMRNEKACLEQWIGVAIGRGIEIKVTPETTLLKRQGRENYYGMKLLKSEKPSEPSRLVPTFVQGCSGKCAKKYQLVKQVLTM